LQALPSSSFRRPTRLEATATNVCQNETDAPGIERWSRFGHQQYSGLDLLRDAEVALTFDDGPLRVLITCHALYAGGRRNFHRAAPGTLMRGAN
jgi:hypothetical protein